MFMNPSQLIVGLVTLLIGVTVGVVLPEGERYPDLQAYETERSVSSVHVGGGAITFTARIENRGDEDAGTFSIGGFYIDTNLDGTAEYLVPAGTVSGITAGDTYTVETVWVVPNEASVGTYRVGYIADVNGVGESDVFEMNESNNWSGWTSFLVTASYPTPPSCPYEPREGRTIVDFTDRAQIYSSKAEWNGGRKETAYQYTSLVPGVYSVRLASWDGYVGRESITQPREEWRVVVSDGYRRIAESNTIPDLADYVREGYKEARVDTNLVIGTSGSVVFGEHAWFEDTSSYNSVMPICAAFDLESSTEEEDINEEEQESNTGGDAETAEPLTINVSACDLDGSNCISGPGTKYIGNEEEVVITWESTGAAECLRTSGPNDFVVSDVSGSDTSVSEPPAGASGLYEVTCVQGDGDTATAAVTVVRETVEPSLSVSSPRVRVGEPVILSWDTGSSDPSTCSLVGGSFGLEGLTAQTGASGEIEIYGLTTFTLSCEYGQESVVVELIQTAYES